jgi:hypothetical protein
VLTVYAASRDFSSNGKLQLLEERQFGRTLRPDLNSVYQNCFRIQFMCCSTALSFLPLGKMSKKYLRRVWTIPRIPSTFIRKQVFIRDRDRTAVPQRPVEQSLKMKGHRMSAVACSPRSLVRKFHTRSGEAQRTSDYEIAPSYSEGMRHF